MIRSLAWGAPERLKPYQSSAVRVARRSAASLLPPTMMGMRPLRVGLGLTRMSVKLTNSPVQEAGSSRAEGADRGQVFVGPGAAPVERDPERGELLL